MMDVKTWRRCVNEVIGQIGSLEYQMAAWFAGEEKVSSPEELYCGLFDDYDYDGFLASEKVGVSDCQRRIGLLLKDKLERFAAATEEHVDPAEIVSDPRWAEIRGIAQAYLKAE